LTGNNEQSINSCRSWNIIADYGLVEGYFAGRELVYNITVANMFSDAYNYLIGAVIAVILLVAGGLMVILG